MGSNYLHVFDLPIQICIRDHSTEDPKDTPVTGDAPGTMFSFWNEFLHEKFVEEGDGVILALLSLEKSITGQLVHM